MEISSLCLGCFEDKGSCSRCQNCGFEQSNGAASPHHLAPGSILNEKYLIGKVLGQGGFGITYLAYDLNLDIKLAIKEYFPQGLVSRSPGTSNVNTYTGDFENQYKFGLDRFMSEAKTLARFSEHPNIVTVRDFFRANGTAYVVMNYLEGITFEEYLKKQKGAKVSYNQAIKILMPVMDALREVHRAGFLHRDVSPDNILINQKGQVILIDFGSAGKNCSIKAVVFQ
jgi:serine/threonine protein kinase